MIKERESRTIIATMRQHITLLGEGKGYSSSKSESKYSRSVVNIGINGGACNSLVGISQFPLEMKIPSRLGLSLSKKREPKPQQKN
jgi:hypothetical protein